MNIFGTVYTDLARTCGSGEVDKSHSGRAPRGVVADWRWRVTRLMVSQWARLQFGVMVLSRAAGLCKQDTTALELKGHE